MSPRVKKILGDIATVASALLAVLTIITVSAPSVHLPAIAQGWIVIASSILAATIAECRRVIQGKGLLK
jgi:hypothetical protein